MSLREGSVWTLDYGHIRTHLTPKYIQYSTVQTTTVSIPSYTYVDLHTSDFMLLILHYNPYLLNKKILNKQKFPSITLGFLNAFLRYFCITNPELFSHAKSNQECGGEGV